MTRQLSTKLIYENKWMRVREDQVEFPNKSKGIYGVVEKPDFAVIIPYENGYFYLVKQFRYTVGETCLEFPQGSINGNNKLKPLEIAGQELKEETGLIAKSMENLGYLYTAYGTLKQGFHIFLAQNLSQGQKQLEVSEGDMTTEKISVATFEKLLLEGQIKDSISVSAYCLWKQKA